MTKNNKELIFIWIFGNNEKTFINKALSNTKYNYIKVKKRILFLSDVTIILNSIVQRFYHKMVSTEGSDNSSTISNELTSNVFSELIIHRPTYLSKIEHDFFRFCNSIISGLQKTKTIDQLFSIFFTIQLFSIICQPSVSIEIQKEKPDITFRLLFSFSNFNLDPKNEPSLFFFCSIDILMFNCVFFFFFGFYLSYKKIYSHTKLQILYSIFVFNFSQLLFFVSASHASRLLCRVIVLKETHLLTQTIISNIYFLIICVIRYLMISTVHQSIVFQNYGFDHIYSDLLLNSAFVIVVIVSNFGAYLLPIYQNVTIQGLLFCFFGLILFYISLFPMNFHNNINSIKLSISFTIMVSGVLSFLQVRNPSINNHTIVFSLFFTSLFFYIFFSYIAENFKKGICKSIEKLNQENPDFDSLPITNDEAAITYLHVIFDEAYPFICNGSFIIWMIRKFDSEKVNRELLIITSLVPIENCEMDRLSDRVINQENKSLSQKFVLFRHFVILSLQTISHVSPKHKQIVKELRGRITQFQSINNCFSKNISDEFETNFLLIDSLATMKFILYNNLRYFLEIYPNSPESLLLYQTYQSKIENNQIKSHKYTELVTELCNGSILFRNFGYIQTFSSYPKIQRALFGKYSHNSNQNKYSKVDAFESKSDNNNDLNFLRHFENLSKNKKQNDLSIIDDALNHFQSKRSVLLVTSWISYSLFLLALLFAIFGTFWHTIQLYSLCRKEVRFILSYANCWETYFMMYFRPLMLFNLYSSGSVSDIFIGNYNMSVRTNDSFILSQISKVYKANKNLRTAAANFRDTFNKLALDFPLVARNFIFLTGNKFVIPSFFNGLEMNSTIRTFFNRISSSLYPFFKDEKTFIPNYSEKIKRIYIQSVIVEQPVFADIMANISIGSEKFIENIKMTIKNSYHFYVIPLFVSILLMATLPRRFKRIVYKSLKRLQIEKTNKNKQAIQNFLEQKFFTLKKISSLYYSFLFLFFVVEFVEIVLHQIPLHNFVVDKLSDFSYHVIDDVTIYYYSTTPLTLFYLSNMSMINISKNYELLCECFNYFMNSTVTGLNIDFSRSNFEMYQYLIKQINFISNSSNTMTRKESDEFINLLDNSLFENLQNKSLNFSLKFFNDERKISNNSPMAVTFLAFIISTFLIIKFTSILNRFVRSLDALFHLLHYCQPNLNPYLQKKINSSSSFDLKTSTLTQKNNHHGHLHNEKNSTTSLSILNSPARFVYNINNTLDFVNKPCVIIDRSENKNVITAANTLWLQFFNCTMDYTIGRPYTDFHLDKKTKERNIMGRPFVRENASNHDVKFTFSQPYNINIPVCESTKSCSDLSLLLVDEIPIDKQLNQEIIQLQNRIFNIRNNHFPRKFINRSDEGTEKIGFNVNVSLMLIPASQEDVSPDLWVDDTDNFEAWIHERCKLCDNVDILNRSCRELTLLFGVDYEDEPICLILEAMTIVCDALRWGLECEWKNTAGILIYAVITCGESAEFVFKRTNSTLILSIFGPSFSKEMILREKVEPNSLVIDSQIIHILGPFKTGFAADPIDDDAYIFRIPQYSTNEAASSQNDLY